MRASRIIMSVDYSIGCGWLGIAFDPFRSGHAVTAGVLFYRQSSVVILPSHMTKRIGTALDVVGLDLGVWRHCYLAVSVALLQSTNQEAILGLIQAFLDPEARLIRNLLPKEQKGILR